MHYEQVYCKYSPTIGGLRILRLHNLSTSAQLTVAELGVILDRSPDLGELALQFTLCSGPPSSSCEKVNLLFLDRLLITAPPSEVFTLLSNVEIPSTTQVRLQCLQKTRPRANDFTPFCSFLALVWHISG